MTPAMLKKPVHVLKFGGTSVATPNLIRDAAKRIGQRRAADCHVVCVVSAMGDTTNELNTLARKLSSQPPRRELDVLLSAGEVQSMALLSIALTELGVPAISFSGQQGGIVTDDRHSEAKILRIDPDRVVEALHRDHVVVLAGFQGIDQHEEITTLGRGGSDTTAVAMAAVLGAERCEILTDVPGVFTADPRLVPSALQIEALSYDEMLEMANLGARVLHGRSVELARRFNVPLVVASATEDRPGTRIIGKGELMEEVVVRAVTDDRDVRKISILAVPDQPGIAARVFNVLGEFDVNVRLIVQAQSHKGLNDITFIVPGSTSLQESDLQRVVEEVGGDSWLIDDDVALLNVVGEGISREPGIAAKIFSVLAEQEINIDLISSSNLVITCVVPEKDLARGVRSLHQALIETDAS
jgi:aspartate kinase